MAITKKMAERIQSGLKRYGPILAAQRDRDVSEADTVRALEGGADACLTEPVEPPVLVATVRALLRARNAEEAMRAALAREQAAREAAETANRAKTSSSPCSRTSCARRSRASWGGRTSCARAARRAGK